MQLQEASNKLEIKHLIYSKNKVIQNQMYAIKVLFLKQK